MKNWIATKRGTLPDINDWLSILPSKMGNYTKVEETINFECVAGNGEFAHYEITVRLSGPHF